MSGKPDDVSPLEVYRRKQSALREAEIELEQLRSGALTFFGERVVEAVGADRILRWTEPEIVQFLNALQSLEFEVVDRARTVEVSVKIGSNCSGERQKLLKLCGLKSVGRKIWTGKCTPGEVERLSREFGEKVSQGSVPAPEVAQNGDISKTNIADSTANNISEPDGQNREDSHNSAAKEPKAEELSSEARASHSIQKSNGSARRDLSPPRRIQPMPLEGPEHGVFDDQKLK